MNSSVTPDSISRFSQPFDGGDVEVVGRLVEQQHLRRHRQRLGQGQAFFLTAGKAADPCLGIEAETRDHPLGLRLVSPGAARFELVLQFGHARQQGFAVGALAQAVRHRVVLGEQARGFAHAGNDGGKHRRLGIEGRFLRHVADADARLGPHLAVVEPATPTAGGQRRQQGRLAGAVAADQRDPLAGVELKIGVIEQRHVAEGKAGIDKTQVGHGGEVAKYERKWRPAGRQPDPSILTARHRRWRSCRRRGIAGQPVSRYNARRPAWTAAPP